MSLFSPFTPSFQMRKPSFREIEAVAKVLESVSGSTPIQPAPALPCGCNLHDESDALRSSGPPPSLMVFLRGDIQLFMVLGASHPCSPGKTSAPGMMPGLHGVLLQSRLQPSLLRASQALGNVRPPAVRVPSCAALCPRDGFRRELWCLMTGIEFLPPARCAWSRVCTQEALPKMGKGRPRLCHP